MKDSQHKLLFIITWVLLWGIIGGWIVGILAFLAVKIPVTYLRWLNFSLFPFCLVCFLLNMPSLLLSGIYFGVVINAYNLLKYET